jgi:hypothetical protein
VFAVIHSNREVQSQKISSPITVRGNAGDAKAAERKG